MSQQQLDMFATEIPPWQGGARPPAEKLARKSDPPSSHAAARAIVESGGLNKDCQRILEILRLRPVMNYELKDIGGLNPRARISNLREAGYVIENKPAKGESKRTTVYTLVSEPNA